MLVSYYSKDRLVILGIVLIVCYLFGWLLKRRHTQKALKNEVIERATALLTPLQQAIVQKNFEEPSLARQNNNAKQLNTRLKISSLYLLICIIGIRQSNSRRSYVNSKPFKTLLKQIQPTLEQIYLERSTKKEHIPKLIENNYQQIKQLIQDYWQLLKSQSLDASIPIQLWFEEKSHVSLATPYIYQHLSGQTHSDIETKLLQSLCSPKKYDHLLTTIKEQTETLMAHINQSSRYATTQNDQRLNQPYLEKYLLAFLLTFLLTIIQYSQENPRYTEAMQYHALKNKAIKMINDMMNNSNTLGENALTTQQISQLSDFMEQAFPALEATYTNYFNGLTQKLPSPEQPIIKWFDSINQTTNGPILNFPFKLTDYVKKILTQQA